MSEELSLCACGGEPTIAQDPEGYNGRERWDVKCTACDRHFWAHSEEAVRHDWNEAQDNQRTEDAVPPEEKQRIADEQEQIVNNLCALRAKVRDHDSGKAPVSADDYANTLHSINYIELLYPHLRRQDTVISPLPWSP